jgi:RecB family exonuclease
MKRSVFVPQLSLEAAMLADGAFKLDDGEVLRAQTKALAYVRFKKPWGVDAVAQGAEVAHVVAEKVEQLMGMLVQYSKETQPFLSKPRAKFVRKAQDSVGEYDLLARRAEWADADGEGE